MPGGPSTYEANLLLNYALRGASYTPPSTLYVALFRDGDDTYLRPNDLANADEVPDAGAYARQAIASTEWATASGGEIVTNVDIVFPTITSGWGILQYGALIDSATYGAGNIRYFGPLTQIIDAQAGKVIRIPAGTMLFGL